ncbi:ComEC/Rec2 family competence protein [Cryobacterium sp. TMT4-10]|uniref:ComEC/Rec2 family competence protein n=1 Tax=Cryobacterium sp. TMT4-10 TaxID=1259256 RepID=UPI0010698CC1|nr:ComEC/Rec2 family competence protein [Cryobacterium sp. TMT4-10]TFD18493.1 MBL fold metallo-hydrolase [Cryobacterium sp. TMT4-10]
MESTTGIDLRLVVPAATAWLAAGVLVGAPGGVPASAAVGLWLGAGLFVVAAVFDRRARWRPLWATVGVSLAVSALVASVVLVSGPARLPADVRAAASRHANASALITVWSVPVETASPGGFGTGGTGARVRFRGTVTELTEGKRSSRVSVPVLVFAESSGRGTASLQIGSVVRLDGSLRATDPGDSAAALFFGRSRAESVAAPPWWLAWANALRTRFVEAARELPGDGGDLLPGLAIGDTSQVSADLDLSMKASSLSHLTAVSGANCAVVIAGIMLLGGYLRLGRGMRITLSLATLLGFVVLVTPEPSVLRAALMATILMLSVASGRPGRGVPLLALVVVVLLVADPWLARSYGFALSALATGGLLVLAGPLTRVLSRWMPTALSAVIAIPLAAQLACQPVLVLLTPTLPLYGVPANLLAGPAAPFATVVGLVACLLLPWLPGIAGGVLYLAWLPAAWIAAIARTSALLPGSRLPWLGGVVGVAATGILTVAFVALVLRRPGAVRGWWPPTAVAVLVLAGGAYTGTLIGSGVGRAVAFPADWQIAACDIGQGDAVVVRDQDLYALVDVGPDPALLAECLDTLGIDRIDLLVLTHYDLDHIGGVEAVIGRVGTALVGVPENAEDERLHLRLARGGADVRQAARGDTGTLGALRWEIFWPVRGSPAMQTGNAGSVTIGFDGRGIRSIFLGDLGQEPQDALRRVAPLATVDVVKVAHHGSRDQSPQLYADLRATVGLISVGRDNGYGHPTDALLGMLASAGTLALRTDLGGMIVVAPAPDGGGALTVWTETVPVGGPD